MGPGLGTLIPPVGHFNTIIINIRMLGHFPSPLFNTRGSVNHFILFHSYLLYNEP
jgi:hypothetical protein